MCIRDSFSYNTILNIIFKEIKEQNIQFQQNINIKFDNLSRVLDKHVDERCENTVSYTHLDVYKRQGRHQTRLCCGPLSAVLRIYA